MFWRINMCFLFIIRNGFSSYIQFQDTLEIQYKHNENLSVTVLLLNVLDYTNYAEIKYSSTNDVIASCNLSSGDKQKHFDFEMTTILERYTGVSVVIYLKDINNNTLLSKPLIHLVYNAKRKNQHECLKHCIIHLDMEYVFHGNQKKNDEDIEKIKKDYQIVEKFLNNSREHEESNNRYLRTPVVRLFPDSNTYYYFPNTNLALTCTAFNFPQSINQHLQLLKDLQVLDVTVGNTLEHYLYLKPEDNSACLHCSKGNYTSPCMQLRLNETYIGNSTVTEDNKNYITYTLIAVIGLLLLSIALWYWKKSRSAHNGKQENDVYTYATSQLTYAQLQLSAQEEKNRQALPKKVPYATIIGVLQPRK